MLDAKLRRSISASTNAEINPIVIQLEEFGYSNIYSRRVFYYLHPEDLEEALNFMSIENNIIQHKFLKDRNPSNKLCYICGEPEDNHLKELNSNNNNLEKIEEENKNEETNPNQNNDKKNEEDKNTNNNSLYNHPNSLMKSINTIKESNYNNNMKNNFDANTNINNNSINSLEFSDIKKNKDDKELNSSIKNSCKINKELENNNNEILEVDNTKIEVKPEEIKKKEECQICNEIFIADSFNTLSKCGHSFCSSCWFDALSVKIKENKLPTIKCLDYNCKEKLPDQFVLNILSSDINLIKKYKRYKLELEIINSNNKKLCPYPNCDSFLELKNINNREVSCLNGHSYCFECLKKPHGNLPCVINGLDKSIINYGMNNFIKKCPKCKIIIEKDKGCNHITCTKCGFQWCWLCNEKYDETHFKQGKCKGFQFFQPKNDYDIKLMMEGKINFNELSDSQRQFDNNFEIDILEVNGGENQLNQHARNEDEVIEIRYHRHKCRIILCKIFFYIFFGNGIFIAKELDLGHFNFFASLLAYVLFNIAFFFQMIFINLISLIIIFIFIGFKKFIVKFDDLYILFVKQFLTIIINLSVGLLLLLITDWKNLINRRPISNKSFFKKIIFFPCFIMTIVILYPQHLLINIICMIIVYFNNYGFSSFTDELNRIITDVFN